ncbi:RNA polymerase sigma factor [Arundinibacter roseus]|uniref:Sigma-70 family RNA polymerase sigma factor n=1 Tax=Arundinibacter roseus TaxID=2070510 RepID=A0A4R4K856_9BACT|nr:sigma-70 family RNA polymerase sigma factor [Arundinibacter roseus]TDB62736.1 sigma-70 family RNA polymerase sigma factor [Arundinibacter roseus]
MPKSKSIVQSPVKTSAILQDAAGQTLWQSFRAGNSDAFAQLLHLYYPMLLNYGVRLSPDREFVKDCLHDLFLEFWNKKEKLSDIENLKSYLLLSFRRKLFRETRRLKWFREANEVTEDYTMEVQFTIESYLINNEVQHEYLKKLKLNLEKLSKRQREVIYLRFYQEMEYDEISAIMEINYHSVVNLIYEALKLLRKNWFLLLFLVSPYVLDFTTSFKQLF